MFETYVTSFSHVPSSLEEMGRDITPPKCCALWGRLCQRQAPYTECIISMYYFYFPTSNSYIHRPSTPSQVIVSGRHTTSSVDACVFGSPGGWFRLQRKSFGGWRLVGALDSMLLGVTHVWNKPTLNELDWNSLMLLNQFWKEQTLFSTCLIFSFDRMGFLRLRGTGHASSCTTRLPVMLAVFRISWT